ncbi:MAG TPA: ATP-binding protein [Ktedonosporobacter sp.]|nr:ATP-binding protein [Ktedonosporobacter sp.]
MSAHVPDPLIARVRAVTKKYTYASTQLPRWRHPLIGYPAGLLLVGLGLGLGLLETELNSSFAFPGIPLLFAIVLAAFLWGVGPAMLATLLSLLVLDYLYIPPFAVLGNYTWDGLLQLLTFAAVGTIISILASQRESARLRAVKAEQEAACRARQLAATFDAMSDSVVVYDKKGQVLQTNAATSPLFGIDSLPEQDQIREAQHLLPQTILYDEQGQMLPTKRQPLSRLLRGEVLTGTKATDVQIQTAPGRKLVLNMSGAPIQDETGTIERVVLIYRDVTERRRLEQRTSEALNALLAMAQALVEFPERFPQDEKASPSENIPQQLGQRLVELTASVVESTHVALLMIEPEEDVMELVASRGFTAQEEQQWREQIASSPHLEHHIGGEMLVSYLKNDEVVMLDGMSLPLHTQVLPYYVQTVLAAPICVNDALIGVLCVDDGNREHTYTANEMTLIQTVARLMTLILARERLQQERAQAQASELASREANRRMEEFLGIVCHELKTPLTIVRGSLQLAERKVKRLVSSNIPLADEIRGFAPVQELLKRAKSQLAVQDRLVNDLLDLSRIQMQTLKLHLLPCDLVQLVQDTVEDQRRITPSRTINMEPPAREEVYVSGDLERLIQVLSNYLTNALKYSPFDRPITVSLRTEDQQALVSVRDEGPGLAEAEYERIWDRFYRVPGVERESGSGVGLGVGLHLCRIIIEQHGGTVGVQSTPGEGSTFWFRLPLIKQPEW